MCIDTRQNILAGKYATKLQTGKDEQSRHAFRADTQRLRDRFRNDLFEEHGPTTSRI